MVTEKGGIKSTAVFDEKLYFQLNRLNFICCVLVLMFGVFGLAVTVAEFLLSGGTTDLYMIIVFCVLTVFGLLLVIMMRLGFKRKARADKSNVTEIFSDHFLVEEFERGRKVGEAKVYFNTLYTCRETADYFFAYVTRTAVHPIGKRGMSFAERAAVRKVMGLPYKSELVTSTVVPALLFAWRTTE